MSIIHWSPQGDPFTEMDDAFNRLPALNKSIKTFMPAIDVYETDKGVVVETALAGVSPKNVKVSVEKGVLTVQGENLKEREIDEKNYYRKEVRSGAFFRQIALPSAIKEEDVKAEYEDGILKITCPKAKSVESKKIEVKIVKKDKK